ncbi:hypothetical protein A2Z33_03725 [Candidatus Gottesmanbacteria bacterium RBG_16_52_11]|uniref:Glycosyltransferase subfamily 4-like N-terminal domain-containing protein n=1 Tax=Candidatus Gottesmanbacteria bacterium RBG_16_52_11 TaxID=1798374 RepID=A0A1F5YVX8_9BACT|nr:MAG: hypothetical protein A2Z33_03725 [Candidatus Gottesmanbacteria bacterium RBG_16_52_11]
MERTKPRVLFLLTYYRPHWTGLTQYAARLAEGLAGSGYDVSVVTTRHDGSLPGREMIRGVRILRSPVLFRFSRTLISPAMFPVFVRELLNCDRVIIFLPFAEVALAAIIARGFGKPVYLVHNGDLRLPAGVINRILESTYTVSTLIGMFASRAIVGQSKDYSENSAVLSKAGTKLRIIPPLFPPDYVSAPRNQKPVRRKAYTVGFAGRFVEEKGFDRLIRAAPLVWEKLPDTRFVYAGETKMSYEQFFERFEQDIAGLGNRMTMSGRLDEAGMRGFYRTLDVLVVPSRSDCFPSVLVEGMLSGVPAVVADIPGARSPVRQTGMGETVDAADPAALAGAIIRVLTHKSVYTRNWKKVTGEFSYERTLREYRSLLEPGD